MLTLSERLKLESRNRKPHEVIDLILDNSKATEIEGLTNEYTNLKELSLVNVGLVSLKNFPSLPNLEKLDLSDNRISSGLEFLKTCPKLKTLYLSNNRIRHFNSLQPLSQLQNLEVLDLCNCDVTTTENYRTKAFEIFHNLKYLDGYAENEDVAESESDSEEEQCLANIYDLQDDYEDNQPVSAKYSHAKNGKFKSKICYNAQESTDLTDDDDDDEVEEQAEETELYCDGVSDNPVKAVVFSADTINDRDLLENTSDDEEYGYPVTDVIVDSFFDHDPEVDIECLPPAHGSKFVPEIFIKQNNTHHDSRKRNHHYFSDDYESSTSSKMLFLDSDYHRNHHHSNEYLP